MTSSDSSDSTGGEPIYTPAGTESPQHGLRPVQGSSRQPSPNPLPIPSLPDNVEGNLSPDRAGAREHHIRFHDDVDEHLGLSDSEMSGRRKTSRGYSNTPLLAEDKENLRGRRDSHNVSSSSSHHIRRGTFRSRSPTYATPENLTRRKYIYASFFLLLSLISFVVQTETAVYIQHELKWNKAYCMLWLTHGSWSLLWPFQLLIIRIQKRHLSWPAFWRRHTYLLRTTAQMVQSQDLYLSPATTARRPWSYMAKMTAFITTFLTMAGGSWYVAVNMTTPSDLTAIYNCSAFFAYVFSILLLNDKLRYDKMFSVGLAIVGVLVVAYGDKDEPKHGSHSGGATNPNHDPEVDSSNKVLGNIIIGIGSVLYGLYEVLYKKYACPPEGTSPGRGMIFANSFGSMVGVFTLTVLWIPLPILNWTGIEKFELPRGKAAYLLAVSTLSNAVFSGSFLVLMSLTSPVLSSVAALLTIFLVAITDWLLTGKPLSAAAVTGGTLIILAFCMLSWATYREMSEEQRKRAEAEEGKVFDDEDMASDEDDDDDEDKIHDLDRARLKRSGSND